MKNLSIALLLSLAYLSLLFPACRKESQPGPATQPGTNAASNDDPRNLMAQVVKNLANAYVVDGSAANAADTNPGSAAKPWKTISRAASAKELKPGDTVLIQPGVYRETVNITVSGEEGKPITFLAEPGTVVIKGSELIKGTWEEVAKASDVKEPFPNAFKTVFRIKLGKEYFTDAQFATSFDKPEKWYVSQVFMMDRKPLQKIGPDEVYKNGEYPLLRYVGRGLADMIDESFYYDAATQYLYVRVGGHPSWYSMEIGVRGTVLSITNVHDLVVRGLDCRHNRMPAGQWSMAGLGNCRRVVVEDCRFELSDFCGFGMSTSKNCIARNCDASYNGNTGMNLHQSEDCIVENCRLNYNNYRHFSAGWHTGGMKSIPSNARSIIRGCEAAYNIESPGIWFDADNQDIQVIGNVLHHNGSDGVFFEINRGKTKPADFKLNEGRGVIADNLVFDNLGRGIYISGSSGVWVVHNTVAGNSSGITIMPREDMFVVNNDRVYNNLLIRNYIPAEKLTRGCDLTINIYKPQEQSAAGNFSDYNVYANNCWTPTMRHNWNDDNTIESWRKMTGYDAHSQLMKIDYEIAKGGFRLLSSKELDVADPLPAECPWKPANPKRVGATITRWP